jgi:hypothetical protein
MTRSFVRSAVLAAASAVVVGLVGFGISAQTPGPWKVLFDGKDLSQFTVPAGGGGGKKAATPPPAADAPIAWKVENGVVVGRGDQTPGERRGALATLDKYFDFEFEFEFMLNELPGKCTEELGEKPNAAGVMQKEQNMSDATCVLNSGVNWRSGYQLNLGRRDAGEYVGLVIHRVDPKAIRGNILWLSHGDKAHPGLRKKDDWNTIRVSVKGDHMQAWMNGTKIVDVMDKSTIEGEATWRVPQPVSFQMPYTPGGIVKLRNVRIRTL